MSKAIFVIIFGLAIQLFSQTAIAPSAGDGSEGNPYQIASLENLYWITADELNWDKNYIQTADIDASDTSTWFGGIGWLPIGNSSTKFTGIYDGDGFAINNLSIENIFGDSPAGLFGYTLDAQLKNIGLTNVSIIGSGYVGALAGISSSSIIFNCYSTGYIYVFDYLGWGGGLIGSGSGTIRNCFSRADVDGWGDLGGFAGSFSGTITNCYSAGHIYTKSSQLYGGFICSASPEDITGCFWDIDTSGLTTSSGGIGKTTTEMKALSTFTDAGWDFVDEAINGTQDHWNIDGSYPFLTFNPLYFIVISTKEVRNISLTDAVCAVEIVNIGNVEIEQHGLCWNNTGNPTIDDQKTELGSLDSSIVFESNITNLSPNTIYYVRSYASYDEFTIYGNEISFITLPFATTQPFGSGTDIDPYQIENLENLHWVSVDTTKWGSHYIQTDDINASLTLGWYPNGESGFSGWKPIGNDVKSFTGIYDGQGFVIDELYIDRPTEKYIGLFGRVDSTTIKNIGMTGINIVGDVLVGSLVGSSRYYSLVENCYSEGEVKGCSYVGGLIGSLYRSDATNCYSTGKVEGANGGYNDYKIGGLIGAVNLNCIVKDCYSSCNVEGYREVGGLVASLVNTSVIEKCYSSGSVNGSRDVGGLLGYNNTSSTSNSFWDIETSGQTTSVGGVGKSTEQMKSLSTYISAGWDFVNETLNGTDDYWKISAVTNNGYPYLAWQNLTGIETAENLPNSSKLYQNYPNPFNPETKITFSIPSAQDVKLSVYNSNGQLVSKLINEKLSAGKHSKLFNGESLNSGIYFYKLETGDKKLTRKMLMIK